MAPSYFAMQAPPRGLVWLDKEESSGACKSVPRDRWTRLSAKTFDLMVHAEGPSGSGRYWTVTVGLAGKQEGTPERGFCFTTSTVGWRTLQRFDKLPLPWLEDQDGDGKPELIVWESFPLSSEASLAEYGLAAWVYRVTPDGKFTLDWNLSRKMAAELAAAYRKPLEPDRPVLRETRTSLAQALEAFASQSCIARAEQAR